MSTLYIIIERTSTSYKNKSLKKINEVGDVTGIYFHKKKIPINLFKVLFKWQLFDRKVSSFESWLFFFNSVIYLFCLNKNGQGLTNMIWTRKH